MIICVSLATLVLMLLHQVKTFAWPQTQAEEVLSYREDADTLKPNESDKKKRL